MTRPVLRWWLFVCLTAVAIVLAGLLGFWRLVWAHDVSYLGTGLLVVILPQRHGSGGRSRRRS